MSEIIIEPSPPVGVTVEAADEIIVDISGSGMPGPQGPQGPPGPATNIESITFRHVQATAAAVWTIVHNLGYYPNVTVADSTGRRVGTDIDYPDANTVVSSTAAPFAGEAYLS